MIRMWCNEGDTMTEGHDGVQCMILLTVYWTAGLCGPLSSSLFLTTHFICIGSA